MSKNVSSTCAERSPSPERSSSYTRYSRPCPTADAACSSSIADGRIGSPIARIPTAIAPDVTITTWRPCSRWRATSAQIDARTSRRTSPCSSATIAEPSFATTTLTGMSLRVPIRADVAAGRASPPERRARVELEHDARDLDVLAGLETRRLEGADHSEGAEPVLDVAQRLLVLDVVARDQALDPAAADPVDPVGHALDAVAVVGARAIDAMLR